MQGFGGDWSESKLKCIEEYARSYLNVMQNQDWCSLDYVDAFAGRGTQKLRSSGVSAEAMESLLGDATQQADADDFLVGSALRALAASSIRGRSFDRFLFIDSDRSSCAELGQAVKANFPALESFVEVACEDANTRLADYVDSTDWKKTRALVFLDPYGLEVGWDLIERLAGTKACDVWYLFPLGGVIRMMTEGGKIPVAWETRLDRVFGTEAWKTEFYKENPQQPLFEVDEEVPLRDVNADHVVQYIRYRLGGVFAAVSNAGVLYNSKGAPLFALVLGVANPSPDAIKAALKIANHLIGSLIQR